MATLLWLDFQSYPEGTYASSSVLYFSNHTPSSEMNFGDPKLTIKLITAFEFINGLSAAREKVLRPVDRNVILDIAIQARREQTDLPGKPQDTDSALLHSEYYYTALRKAENYVQGIYDEMARVIKEKQGTPTSAFFVPEAEEQILKPIRGSLEEIKTELRQFEQYRQELESAELTQKH